MVRWIIDLWLSGSSIEEIEGQFSDCMQGYESLQYELFCAHVEELCDRYGL